MLISEFRLNFLVLKDIYKNHCQIQDVLRNVKIALINILNIIDVSCFKK